MFSPVTEAETRQKLLRNVKKEVRGIFFDFTLASCQLMFTAAVGHIGAWTWTIGSGNATGLFFYNARDHLFINIL